MDRISRYRLRPDSQSDGLRPPAIIGRRPRMGSPVTRLLPRVDVNRLSRCRSCRSSAPPLVLRNLGGMDVRAHLLQFLATPQADTRFGQPYLVTEIAGRALVRPHQVYESLWGLVGEGLVYLDPAGQGSERTTGVGG